MRGFASRGIDEGLSNSPVRSSPRLWRPGWNGPPLGLPPSFAPRRPGADDARRGGDRPSSTDLELLAQHHISRSSNRVVVHSLRATSRRTTRSECESGESSFSTRAGAAQEPIARPRTAPFRPTQQRRPLRWRRQARHARIGRVSRTPCGVRLPSEPDEPVSEHPAQASQWRSVGATPYDPLTSRSVPSSGPFTTTIVVASNLSVGSGRRRHLLFTGSPDRVSTLSRPGTRARHPAGYPPRSAGGADHPSRFPVAFRPPAFASRSSCSRRGVGPSLRSAYRTRRRRAPDPDGVTAFRTHELRPGWVPSTSRTAVLSRPSRLLDRRLPLYHGQSLYPASTSHRRGLLHEASTRIHAIHPSGLPLARGRPDGTGRRFGFPPSFAPRRPGADDARRGGDRPTSTDLELLAQHHIGRSSNR
jgi:hypothetical protein